MAAKKEEIERPWSEYMIAGLVGVFVAWVLNKAYDYMPAPKG